MAAGIAGVIYAPLAAVIPNMGEPFLVECFVVVVIGGLGSFPGAVVGGIVVGEILSLTTLFDPAYAQAAIYAVMTLVLIVRPRGLFGTHGARLMAASHGRRLTRWLPEIAMAAALVAPAVRASIAWLGSVDLFTRILIWGIFGLGFDLLFGRTGLLSFGQAAFYGTGGFVTAYLLTSGTLDNVWLAIAAGIAAATAFSVLVGFLALRRVGIYFAMITLGVRRIVLFSGEFAAVEFDRRRERLARRAGAEHSARRVRLHFRRLLAELPACRRIFFVGFVFARFVVLSPVGAVLTGDPAKSGTHRRARPRRRRLQARRVRDCRASSPAAAARCSAFSRAICRRTPSRSIPPASWSFRP